MLIVTHTNACTHSPDTYALCLESSHIEEHIKETSGDSALYVEMPYAQVDIYIYSTSA